MSAPPKPAPNSWADRKQDLWNFVILITKTVTANATLKVANPHAVAEAVPVAGKSQVPEIQAIMKEFVKTLQKTCELYASPTERLINLAGTNLHVMKRLKKFKQSLETALAILGSKSTTENHSEDSDYSQPCCVSFVSTCVSFVTGPGSSMQSSSYRCHPSTSDFDSRDIYPNNGSARNGGADVSNNGINYATDFTEQNTPDNEIILADDTVIAAAVSEISQEAADVVSVQTKNGDEHIFLASGQSNGTDDSGDIPSNSRPPECKASYLRELTSTYKDISATPQTVSSMSELSKSSNVSLTDPGGTSKDVGNGNCYRKNVEKSSRIAGSMVSVQVPVKALMEMCEEAPREQDIKGADEYGICCSLCSNLMDRGNLPKHIDRFHADVFKTLEEKQQYIKLMKAMYLMYQTCVPGLEENTKKVLGENYSRVTLDVTHDSLFPGLVGTVALPAAPPKWMQHMREKENEEYKKRDESLTNSSRATTVDAANNNESSVPTVPPIYIQIQREKYMIEFKIKRIPDSAETGEPNTTHKIALEQKEGHKSRKRKRSALAE